MRKFYYSVFTLCAVLLTLNPAQAQLFEDFEQNQKLGYASGTVDQSSGTWYLDDALIRNDDARDLKNGALSVRIQKAGFLRMEFDVSGANELIFLAGNSSFNGDGGGKIQVFQSTDGGGSWVELGDEITLTNSLDSYSILVETQDDIRFRFGKTAGGRVNIDDIRVTEYVIPEEEPTIEVSVDGVKVQPGDSLFFNPTLLGNSRDKKIEIKNRGNQTLNLEEVEITSSVFTVSEFSEASLELNEASELTLTFAPEEAGDFNGSLTIYSNAENEAAFVLNYQGQGVVDGTLISIAEARQRDLGSRVTITGRVTVANEYGGPVSIEDGTGGMSIYYVPLHTAVEIGDSIIVSGPLTVFRPGNVPGSDSDFPLQIAEIPTDTDIIFEVIDAPKRILEPTPITVQEMNTGKYESRLVYIDRVAISHTGAFQGNTNYSITDGTGNAFLRISANSNLVDAMAPTEAVNVIGIVDKFTGDYQLKPRFAEDLGVEAISYPYEDISKDLTLDVVTWNIEWFGGGNGPDDTELQLQNVKTVIDSLDADLYAFQEISSPTMFARLIDELDGYGGFQASFSQQQKTAYLFKRATIDSLGSGLISNGFATAMWANGRFPLMFRFKADINDEQQEIYAYNVHMKAFDDESSYNQRLQASAQMKTYLDTNRKQDKVIFLGDFNDTMSGSITSGKESPYKNFVDDPEYTVITKNLEDKGYRSQSIGSFIDHIMFNSQLSEMHLDGAERVENTNYIGSYLSTTSDHYPIWTRFQFGEISLSIEEPETVPSGFVLEQNYPNPFNPSTTISYQLPVAATVKLEVYDILGQNVATLVNGYMPAGHQSVQFDASTLSSGVYLYRLSVNNHHMLTRKMLLLK